MVYLIEKIRKSKNFLEQMELIEHENVRFPGGTGEFGYDGVDFTGSKRKKSEPQHSLEQ